MINSQTKIKSKFIIPEIILIDAQIEIEYGETMVLIKMNVEYEMEFGWPKISQTHPIGMTYDMNVAQT